MITIPGQRACDDRFAGVTNQGDEELEDLPDFKNLKEGRGSRIEYRFENQG